MALTKETVVDKIEGWNDLEPDVAQFSGGILLFYDDAGDWVHTNTLQTSNDRNHAYSNFTYEIS